MHINGAECDELLAIQLAEVTIDELDQATQLADLWVAAAESRVGGGLLSVWVMEVTQGWLAGRGTWRQC